jgi:hypothetical protein
MEADEPHVEAIGLKHGVKACHGAEKRQENVRDAGTILRGFPGRRKEKKNHGQEKKKMKASQNPGRRGPETGGVEMKNPGNDADDQDREIPPPLETSHEAALMSEK